jgi:hypothetical protein
MAGNFTDDWANSAGGGASWATSYGYQLKRDLALTSWVHQELCTFTWMKLEQRRQLKSMSLALTEVNIHFKPVCSSLLVSTQGFFWGHPFSVFCQKYNGQKVFGSICAGCTTTGDCRMPHYVVLPGLHSHISLARPLAPSLGPPHFGHLTVRAKGSVVLARHWLHW